MKNVSNNANVQYLVKFEAFSKLPSGERESV